METENNFGQGQGQGYGQGQEQPAHFKGKDALSHVIEAQAAGIISAAEVHGIEPPGAFSAAGDAAREVALLLPLLWLLLHLFVQNPLLIILLSAFSFVWLLWKTGRSSWLGWFRLERLHRILTQERWEIEHHRQQERDELRVLYQAKGFEGKLLEDVLDVLMADNDRLLKVMVEEELGLSLASFEHPLRQGLGAAIGAFVSALICLGLMALFPSIGILIGAIIVIAATAALSAQLAQNHVTSAVVWNLGLSTLAFGALYFLIEFIQLQLS